MKKLLHYSFYFIGITSFAQQHGIKLNATSLFSPNFLEVQYEYVATPSFSIQASAGYGFKRMRFIKALEAATESTLETGETNPYADMNNSAYRLTLEGKLYVNGESPNGFYVSPFLRHYSYGFKSSYSQDLNDDINIKDIQNINFKGTVNATAFGIGIGYQWLIEEKWAIDVMFFGIGYGSGKIQADYTSSADINWDDVKTELDKSNLDSEVRFIREAEITSYSDGVTLQLKNPLPLVLRSNISVGYFF